MAKAEAIEELDCDARINDGALLVLSARLREMCALRERALDFTDIEGVHDMRVASRRLRSALRDFAPYLRKKAIPQRRLKVLADTLGLVRDEDVAIEALEKLKGKASEQVAPGIEKLIDERSWRRVSARESLQGIVAEDSLAAMQEKYLARFARALRPDDVVNGKGQIRLVQVASFRQAGREIILARFAELQDLSSSLYHPFEVDRLHRMRIAAKRLRYAIELFSTCWGKPLLQTAKEIAELQSSLGELHDCDVWITDLGARLDTRGREQKKNEAEASGTDGRTREAAVWLLGHFVKERARHFQAALARWNKWEGAAFPERLKNNLADAGQAAEVSSPAPQLEPEKTPATSINETAPVVS